MMQRRVMLLPYSRWVGRSVPSTVKYRSAVSWGSMRFNQDAFAGGQAFSALFACAQAPARRGRGAGGGQAGPWPASRLFALAADRSPPAA